MQHIGAVNWIGLYTLCKRETWRFLKVSNQTILSPVVTTLLYLAIFSLALGGASHTVEDVPFSQFIAPGLIMMAVVQNAFANTSSSLMLSKIQGVIIDLIMPPITASELAIGLVMGGLIRGFLVGVAVTVAVAFFVPVQFAHPGLALFYILACSIMLALIGVLTGIWAQTFDQLAVMTNYVITPLAFLSGTFYSVKQLPGVWHDISHWNPFFYMIDGFRYSMIGLHDGSITIGVTTLIGVNVALWGMVHFMLARGYRLKS